MDIREKEKQDGYEYGQKVEGGVEEGGWKLGRREGGGDHTQRHSETWCEKGNLNP